MKASDVVIPEETTEVKLAMRVAELEAENKYLKLEAKEDEELIDKLEAERDRVMRENGKLNCHIDDLEAEIERLRSIADNNAANGLAAEERIVELENKLVTKVRHCDVTNRIAQLEAEHDKAFNAGLEAAATEVLKVGGPGYEYLAASIRALKEES